MVNMYGINGEREYDKYKKMFTCTAKGNFLFISENFWISIEMAT